MSTLIVFIIYIWIFCKLLYRICIYIHTYYIFDTRRYSVYIKVKRKQNVDAQTHSHTWIFLYKLNARKYISCSLAITGLRFWYFMLIILRSSTMSAPLHTFIDICKYINHIHTKAEAHTSIRTKLSFNRFWAVTLLRPENFRRQIDVLFFTCSDSKFL